MNIQSNQIVSEAPAAAVEAFFQDAAKVYLDHCKADYLSWQTGSEPKHPGDFSAPSDYGHTWTLDTKGQKFQRVIHKARGGQKSSHSFLVLQSHTTSKGLVLKRGDVLKCASWKAPALNFIRANIFQPDTFKNHIRWTGVN